MAAAVSRAVSDKQNLLFPRSSPQPLVEPPADCRDQIEILVLASGADHVRLSRLASMKYQIKSVAVIDNIQPVATLFSVTVHRNRKPGHGVSNNQRYQLLRELIWSEIVR